MASMSPQSPANDAAMTVADLKEETARLVGREIERKLYESPVFRCSTISVKMAVSEMSESLCGTYFFEMALAARQHFCYKFQKGLEMYRNGR
jgi:hypothetical protein